MASITLRAAAAEHDADLTRIVFLSTLFTFSDTLQVLKSLLMSGQVESGVLDEGDSAGLQDSLENHFRDMFLECDAYITLHARTVLRQLFNRLFGDFMS